MTSSCLKALALSTILAFTPLLAACDKDEPQTPQKESMAEPSAEDIAAIEPAAGEPADTESALPQANVPSQPTDEGMAGAVDSVVPQNDDMGGNAGPTPDEIPAADIPPAPNRAVFTDNSCDFESWVGKPLDEAAIKKLNRPTRILKPGDAMTMDHSPARVNVEHKDGVVTRVWCG